MICIRRIISLNSNLIPKRYQFNRSIAIKTEVAEKLDYQNPQYDLDYICNPANKEEIEDNIKKRRSTGNINRVLELHEQLNKLNKNSGDYVQVENSLLREVRKLPNKLHDAVKDLIDQPRFIRDIGTKNELNFNTKEFHEISKNLRVCRRDNLSKFTNHRSYFFMGQLAEMEAALVKYSLKNLLSKNFKLISVPDILNKHVIESCGMDTEGDRTQVYSLDSDLYGDSLCLSGTSEMAIAGYLMNKTFSPNDIPLRIVAVSRCFRAETSRTSEEKGIFRVHQFTKVEMFGVSQPEMSDEMLEEFLKIEESFFESLGLHLKTFDMAPGDLGNQACRKYDIEAWLPGRKIFGEVSSCSNCTDYQSRRLNIKVGDEYAHTLNGTACAIPRLIIAIIETHQNKDGTVNIPKVLQPYMGGETLIKVNSNVPKMKSYKATNKY